MKIVIKLFLANGTNKMHFLKDKNLHCNNSKKAIWQLKPKKRINSSDDRKCRRLSRNHRKSRMKLKHTEKFMIVKAKRVEPTQSLVMLIGINKINDSNSGFFWVKAFIGLHCLHDL